MTILEELKRKINLKKYVTELKNKKLVLSKNNYLVVVNQINNKKEILKLSKINTLTDYELIDIIKYYDSIQKTNKKIIENVNEIKNILKNRLTLLIKTSFKIINNEELNYEVILETKERLEYYISNVIDNKKLIELANNLDLVIAKKGLKRYEKIHLPIKQIC